MKTEPYLKSIKIFENIAKITLNKNFFKTNKIDVNTPLSNTTKNKLQNLLQLNPKTKNWSLKPNLTIEAIETNSENFEIFFSKPENSQNTTPNSNSRTNNKIAIISKFNKLHHLKFFCKNIIQTYKPIWLTSELHSFQKLAFILIVKTNQETENEFSALLTEFNATTEKGKFQEAIAKEHCQKIFANHAIEKISLID